MSTVTTITEAQSNIGLNSLNNGTSSIQLVCTYPSFDVSFDSTFLEDLYIESLNGFQANEVITVSVGGTSLGNFTISADTKSIWLSELIGVTRQALNSKTSETIQFDFATNKLLKFILVSATSVNFISASIIQSSGLGSNMYQLAISEVQSKDENSLSALRSAIDTTKTTITGNGTNVITVSNEFEVFGSALDKTLVVDDLITFSKALNIGTQIYIKKDGNYLTTFTAKSNITSIWLSELLGLSNREFLYQKPNNEIYELTFIFDTQINNQVVAGTLTNFVSASVASVQLTQNLFELANAHALDSIPISTSDCNYVVTYDSENKIKSAVYQINNDQVINYDFVCDNSGDVPKYLVKQSNVDNVYNISIDLIMDYEGIVNEINMLRNLAREMIDKNSQVNTTTK